MKLQKHKSRVVDGKKYSKWVLVIPPNQINELCWSEGDELESFAKGQDLLIKRVLNPKEKPKKMTYDEFKMLISDFLKEKNQGMTWTKIRDELGLPQKVPNNLWVRMLKEDIGLLREKRGAKTIWKLR